MLKTRICIKCKIEKFIKDFHKSKTCKFGVTTICKLCSNNISREKRKNNINYFKEKNSQMTYVICEFCNTQQYIHLYECNRNKKRNNGIYRCKRCAIQQTIYLRTKYNKNENYFENIDSEVKAYILGIIAGDGHLSKNGSLLEVVANKDDKETLELIIKEISPNTKISKHSSSPNCVKVNIFSKKINRDVCNHLMIFPGKKSDKISLPNINDELTWHFIRGLMDSDGWISDISKSKKIRCFYSSTSKKMIEQIKAFVDVVGISCHVNGIKLCFNGKNAKNFLSLVYANSSYRLSRKYKRYCDWSLNES